ncbi:hypothetical protein Taro_010500 [Colocasia esculenta]|uniref:Transmembrane protein 53 n=1 Tax=Colocasia esculenta TaxID=4460 RepID=A0A843U739_COLES|nr:hypothetical protein [Colocasia esculenta]
MAVHGGTSCGSRSSSEEKDRQDAEAEKGKASRASRGGQHRRPLRPSKVDSGESWVGDVVWAAGFCAALLKKQSSLTYASVESLEGKAPEDNKKRLMTEDSRPDFVEFFLLSILEKLFTLFLRLPYINQRLNKIITILSQKQPPCPQLYLYSSADKVIPVHSIELFIQEQKSLGREVWAYDFISSPHVDHFRTFPHIYSAKLDEFLKECAAKLIVFCLEIKNKNELST